MSRKEPGFAERLQTAVKAKQTQLEKMRATALANDAQSARRQAARVETAEFAFQGMARDLGKSARQFDAEANLAAETID